MDSQVKVPAIRRKPLPGASSDERPSEPPNPAFLPPPSVSSPASHPPRSTTHDLIYDDDPPPYEEVSQQRPALSPRFTAPALPPRPRPNPAATFSPTPPQPTSTFTSFSQLPLSLAASRSTPNLRAAFTNSTPPPPLPSHERPAIPSWKSALDSTRTFASSLIPHPAESTSHFSILRHSPPLIIYRGPNTSVAITIFSAPAHPLPPTRRLLLQRRGYSGDAGLALKGLVGADKDWIDVSPERRVEASQVDAADEKAWARDIAKFLAKRAAEVGEDEDRLARETCVVRIPAAAANGYFRLVMCSSTPASSPTKPPKLKTLCPSPLFRIASASMDPAVVRGAPLAALPLEVALKAASTIGRTVAARAAGPAALAAQAPLKRIKSAAVMKKAGSSLVKSGARGVVGGLEDRYKGERAGRYGPLGERGGAQGLEDEVLVVGPDEGPEDPFPIKFSGKVVRGSGRAGMEVGIPTANLDDVPDDVKGRLRGVYFGWACVLVSSRTNSTRTSTMSHDWHASIISISPSPYATPTTVARNIVTAHLLHDFGSAMFFDTKMNVILMGRLRDDGPSSATVQERLDVATRDAFVAVSSLSREHWGPDMTLERIRTERGARTFTDRYMDARDAAQKQVDRVPMHWVGMRTTGSELRDQALGAGGFWVARG